MSSNKHIENVFQTINKFTTLNSSDREETAKNFNAVRDYVLQKMRDTDKLFKQLTRGHSLTGSYADNLKICIPNEFDLLLPMKIPYADITADQKRPGNVLINIKKSLEIYKTNPDTFFLYMGLQKMADENFFLLQSEVQSWIQGILDTIKLHGTVIRKDEKSFQLAYKTSGPAHTFCVKTRPYNFDIDFVPALLFKVDKWVALRKRPDKFNGEWQAIPKPLKGEKVETCKKNTSWQGSYTDAERTLIAGKNNLKTSLRILKKLKERQNNFGPFKSYFIKTMFLWENEKQDANFWKKPVWELVFYMIKKWIEYLKNGNLPFYWNKKCNLLAKKNWKTMSEQLQALYADLVKLKSDDPERILGKFLTNEELKSMDEANRNRTDTTPSDNKNKQNSSDTIDLLQGLVRVLSFRLF